MAKWRHRRLDSPGLAWTRLDSPGLDGHAAPVDFALSAADDGAHPADSSAPPPPPPPLGRAPAGFCDDDGPDAAAGHDAVGYAAAAGAAAERGRRRGRLRRRRRRPRILFNGQFARLDGQFSAHSAQGMTQ